MIAAEEESMAGEPLAEESSTYEANVERWAAEHVGDYVLIRGTEVVGFFATNEKALTEGYKRFGIAPFFVKQVTPRGQAHFISRLAAPATVT